MNNSEEDSKNILCLTLNQDNSFLVAGTESGFNMYITSNFEPENIKKFKFEGGVSLISMINQFCVFLIVGNNSCEKYPDNKLIIWNNDKKEINGSLSFSSKILGINLKPKIFYVILQHKIYVYKFEKFELIDEIKTSDNPKGIYAVSKDINSNLLCYPECDIGTITIKDYNIISNDNNFFVKSIKAHKSQISCIVLSFYNEFLATASEKGTIIRIFRIKDGLLLQELRRGTEYAEIYSIAFNKENTFLCCSSDKGTIHVFNLKIEISNETKNQKSLFSYVTNFFGVNNEYLNSEWSYAKYRLPNDDISKTIVCFDKINSINVFTYKGKFFQLQFNIQKGGEIKKVLDIPFIEK
jgi:WD40 repeat protein